MSEPHHLIQWTRNERAAISGRAAILAVENKARSRSLSAAVPSSFRRRFAAVSAVSPTSDARNFAPTMLWGRRVFQFDQVRRPVGTLAGGWLLAAGCGDVCRFSGQRAPPPLRQMAPADDSEVTPTQTTPRLVRLRRPRRSGWSLVVVTDGQNSAGWTRPKQRWMDSPRWKQSFS